jgi:rhamnose utilization protein RhaD (predicted bifunctional aldolase and dehydrogenase)/NAD(P)-dependent dehydrogenase (short-subunit alcohol dehydrogenase family)
MVSNSWIEADADAFVKTWSPRCGADVALLAYATRLVGSEPDLAMHGGGNTSLKTTIRTLTGEDRGALFVKASGAAMGTIDPSGFVCLDHLYLKKLRAVDSLTDEMMADEFRTHLLLPGDSLPSIETLMHAFVDRTAVVHTHPSAILALSNRDSGEETIATALGSDVGVVPYANAGLSLGRAVADLLDTQKGMRGIVVCHHGLITYGTSIKQAYDNTMEMVNRAEEYIRNNRRRLIHIDKDISVETAQARYARLAPVLRGLLSPASGDPDSPHLAMSLVPLITPDVLGLLDSNRGRGIALSQPLTPDYLVRMKSHPLFVDNPNYDDGKILGEQLARDIAAFSDRYEAYRKRYASRLPEFNAAGFDLLPRVVLLPGLGAVCAGRDIDMAMVVRDITNQAFTVKRAIYETGGTYHGLAEEHLFDMEFRGFQVAKMESDPARRLRGKIALVTGSAGAIGSGICEALLSEGCNVTVTDLPGESFDAYADALRARYANCILAAPLDVTDPASVAAAFQQTVAAFGGIDIVVANAGLAHVSSLADMNLDAFRKLERVNIEGTLLVTAEAGRLFRLQNTGGDIVLVSTKNVFAPGAQFGAYSATKAAAHQIGRIASLEFADMGVRVNMVAPDAVFSHGSTKSGLWKEVGPGRMKSRGLDEKGLEEYYRTRNLLKAKVTAQHVARAVLFFVTHQTPTTGATIPVDGGLPDATPR